MSNPIPYNQLFDIDGLKAAIIDTQASADEFKTAVTEDFKRIQDSVAALKKDLLDLNNVMSGKSIKIIDEAGQQAIQNYTSSVLELSTAIKALRDSEKGMTTVVNANKQAIADAKTAAAQYAAQVAKGKADQQAINVQIAQTTLQLKQLALANKTAAQAQTAATGSYNEATSRLRALGNQIKSLPGEFQNATAQGRALVAQYNQLNNQLKAFDSTMGNHQRNVGNYGSVIHNLQGELTQYAANLLTLAAAMAAVNKTFDAALTTDATRASLGYILANSELADEKLRALKETANRLGLEFVSTAKAYALFTGAAEASNFSLDQADKIFNSVARAVGVLHLPAEQASNAFYALQEMISKGTIQSKELQRQLGQAIPGSVNIMATALGISVQRLHEMEKSGELLTIDVLPKFAAQLDKTFAPGIEAVDSLQASVNRLNNTFTEGVDENTRIVTFFKNMTTGLSNLSSSLIKTVNSTSWQEFWMRVTQNATIDAKGLASMPGADILHDVTRSSDNAVKVITQPGADAALTGDKKLPIEQITKRVSDLKIALAEARSTYMTFLGAVEKGQVKEDSDMNFSLLKKTYDSLEYIVSVYKSKFPEAFQTTQKANKELTDAQLTSIEEIRKRISELSKLPGSGIKGNPIEERIEALRKRLHELQPDLKKAKDGFEILETQIKNTLLALQDSIIQDYAAHQGRETENTKKLANSYEYLIEKLNRLKKAQEDAILNSQRAAQIAHYGSVFPVSGDHGASQPNLSIDPNKRGNKSTLGNDLLVGQDNIDIVGLEKSLDNIVKKYATANIKIADDFKKRNITKLQYDQELLGSERSEANEEYFTRASILVKQLEIAEFTYGEDSKQYSALLAQKAKLDKDYSDKSLRIFIETEEKKRKQLQETIELLSSSANLVGAAHNNPGLSNLLDDLSKDMVGGIGKPEVFQDTAKLGMDAVQTYTDFAVNASRLRQSQFEREMAYEIQGAGSNSIAKQKIEKEYNDKITAEKRKQAKLQKAAAAIEIIINTAIAISKTLAETAIFGIPLIPIIAGLGAAELGLVLATPLPQYEKGRESGPRQFAEVNEKGPEALIYQNKVRFANKGRRGITLLRENERVLTADDTSKWISSQIDNSNHVSKSRQMYDTFIATASSGASFNYDRMGEAVSGAVAKLPLEQNIWNEKGHAHYRREQNASIKSVRERNKI